MNILIVDEVHPILMDDLGGNYTIDYKPGLSYNETLEIIGKYHCLIVRSGFFIDDNLLSKGTNLKLLARAGVGLDIFDLNAAAKRNIKVINAAGANANSVAEHVLGLMLSLLHNINKSSTEVESFLWQREENRGDELYGKTVGLIGYGFTGKAVARKLKSFDCNVLAYDKYLTNFSDEYANEATIDEIFQKADIVSLHIPLTEETLFMCNDEFFESFKKDIYFFNTSRGKIVETQSIINQLERDKIKGCGLDVVENEKIDSLSTEEKKLYSILFNKKNVILTPHIAGWSYQSYLLISKNLSEKIKSLTY